MKIIGGFTILIHTILLGGLFILLNTKTEGEDYYTNLTIFGIFYIVFSIIFFKVVIVSKEKIIICRPLWFLYKRNIVYLSEIEKVELGIALSSKGSLMDFTITDKNGEKIISIVMRWFKFEAKNMAKVLDELDIKVDFTGYGW